MIVAGGIAIATRIGTVARHAPLKSTYAEPTVMWRLCNSDDGRHAFAVIVPHGTEATAGWFSQGIPQEAHHFPTWLEAMEWINDKFVILRLHGWYADATE